MCISAYIYAEYEEVISRAKFGLERETIAATLESIREKAHWLRPGERVQARRPQQIRIDAWQFDTRLQ